MRWVAAHRVTQGAGCANDVTSNERDTLQAVKRSYSA